MADEYGNSDPGYDYSDPGYDYTGLDEGLEYGGIGFGDFSGLQQSLNDYLGQMKDYYQSNAIPSAAAKLPTTPTKSQVYGQDVNLAQALAAASKQNLINQGAVAARPTDTNMASSTAGSTATRGREPGRAYFPDGTPVPTQAEFNANRRAMESNYYWGPNGQGAGNNPVDRYNQNLNEAKNRALADRNTALGAGRAMSALAASRLGTNPFGPEFQAAAQGILRDARARQYQAAVAQLSEMYARLGRPVDPRMLAVLRQQQAQEENGDLRNLLVDTAGKAFAANESYVAAQQNAANSMINILGSTNYNPGTQDLAMWLALAGRI